MINGVTQAEAAAATTRARLGTSRAPSPARPQHLSTNRFQNSHVPGSWAVPIDKAEYILDEKLVPATDALGHCLLFFPADGDPLAAPKKAGNVIGRSRTHQAE